MNSLELIRVCRECGLSKPIDNFRVRKLIYHARKCTDCANKDTYQWRRDNPDKWAATLCRFRTDNLKALRLSQKKSYHKNRNVSRDWSFKQKFGISLSDYETLVMLQSGLCAICMKPETVTNRGKVKSLAVDHNHITNKVRGLLCQKCNIGTGHLLLDVGPEILLAALEYQRKHSI